MYKFKISIQNLKFLILNSIFAFCILNFTLNCLAQESDLEFTLDINSKTIPLPKIFKPNIDLSGRGFHHELSWPQVLAAKEALEIWQKDIGWGGIYRLQYNLWEITELAKDKNLQEKLLANYEEVFKKITDAGGTVVLSIFGTPAGLGKVLDKKSPSLKLMAFKELIKSYIRNLSCQKKYNIWYEVWSAPDLDNFFLGRKQEYLNMYRMVAQAIKELESETKIHIPLGGPSTSWWFQNPDGNTIITPERSLIYELIKFCYHYRLPLDFISWHAYSTDPKIDIEETTYNKKTTELIRSWLSYFHFSSDTCLLVDEWNYDSGANLLAARQEKSNIAASFIPSRIQNMYRAGLDNQIYFSLEDFKDNKENVLSNVGVFGFDSEASGYKGNSKSIYNAFWMLRNLTDNMFIAAKLEDEFVGVIATRGNEEIVILIYNYIDPQIALNYLSRNIASLNSAERKKLLGIIKSDQLEKILHSENESDISSLRTTHRVKALLKKAKELNLKAQEFTGSNRNIKISIKNLNGNYGYQRYVVDSDCVANCKFAPQEEKEINASDLYQETLSLKPYSVNLLKLKIKPQEIKEISETATSASTATLPENQIAPSTTK